MNLIMRRVRVGIVIVKISITYSECAFVALVFQHSMRIHRIILPFVSCIALLYFYSLFHKMYNFRENVIEHKI